jgi:hypothetical protein
MLRLSAIDLGDEEDEKPSGALLGRGRAKIAARAMLAET